MVYMLDCNTGERKRVATQISKSNCFDCSFLAVLIVRYMGMVKSDVKYRSYFCLLG